MNRDVRKVHSSSVPDETTAVTASSDATACIVHIRTSDLSIPSQGDFSDEADQKISSDLRSRG
jgi:hypothetical protein